jgi:hypothetical protein
MALLDLLRWRLRMLRLAFTLKPIRGADDPPDDPPKDDPKPDDPPKDDPPDDDPDKVTPDDDWQAKARKHERAAKAERKRREDLERQLKEKDDEDKTEQQKAIDKAREDGKAEALTAAEKDRRSDRLEVAVTRLASKGITFGQGDDAKTLKFADSDDALGNIERMVARGDIDADDIFDSEGKVNADALQDALADLLKSKPHLAAGDAKPPPGDADTRKGGRQENDEESLVKDYLAEKYAEKT